MSNYFTLFPLKVRMTNANQHMFRDYTAVKLHYVPCNYIQKIQQANEIKQI